MVSLVLSVATSTVASTPLKLTSPPLSMRRAASSAPSTPTLSSTVIEPSPADSVNVRPLPSSRTSSSRMAPSFEVNSTSATRVIGAASTVIADTTTVVSISAPRLIEPVVASSKRTVPAAVIFAFKSATPLLVTVTVPAAVVIKVASSVSVLVLISTFPATLTAASNSTSTSTAAALPIVNALTSTVAWRPLKCTSPAL